MALATIEEAIEEIRRGRMVILMDDKDRENEGDLCMAAEKVTPQAINFMATHGRGLICLPLTEERVKHLQLSMMVSENTSPFGTAFTVSVDATSGITTGISAADRAKTILDAIGCGNTGGDSRRGINGYRKSGTEGRHICQKPSSRAADASPVLRSTEQMSPRPWVGHEVNGLRNEVLRRHTEVALVLAVFVIHQDGHPAPSNLFDGLFDRCQSARSSNLPILT